MMRRVRCLSVSTLLFGVLGTSGLAAQERDCVEEAVTCFESARDAADWATDQLDKRDEELQAVQNSRNADWAACRAAARSSAGEDSNRIDLGGCASFRDELRDLCRRRVAETSIFIEGAIGLGTFDCYDSVDELHDQREREIFKNYEHLTGGVTRQTIASDRAHSNAACGAELQRCKASPPGGQGGSGGAGGTEQREEPCPSGTEPSPLGLCTRSIRPDGVVELAGPDDRCPPGMAPGPDDRCRPTVASIGVRPLGDADGYWVICPQGTRPSPVDGGCVLDRMGGSDEVPSTERGWQCPPGSVSGPDDDCVPDLPNSLGLRFEGQFPRLNGLRVEDPERALAVTERALREGFERGWDPLPDPR